MRHRDQGKILRRAVCARWVEAKAMSDERKSMEDEHVPVMQQLLDNPFILLFIGILIPTMTYIVWGIMELISIPIAQ